MKIINADVPIDLDVFFCYEDALQAPKEYAAAFAQCKSIDGFLGKASQGASVLESGKRVAFIGLGKKKELTTAKLLAVCASIFANARESGKAKIGFTYTDALSQESFTQAIVQGVTLRSYEFSRKTDNQKKKDIELVAIKGCKVAPAYIAEQEKICAAINHARELVNERGDVITPDTLEKEFKAVAAKAKTLTTVTVLSQAELEKKGLNLILAVGKGSQYKPRLVIVEYDAGKKGEAPLAIVGKGVTFDTGGIHLKPTKSIETMFADMGGAAVVLGTLEACIALNIKKNLIFVAPLVENAIGSRATLPSCIITSYSGKTVEIGNTDAEGRLILADAISYCEKNYKPATIIEFSTLTGAASIALGSVVAALMSKDDKLAEDLFAAGERSMDRVWRLPFYQEYFDMMKGDVSDLKNISGTRDAGTITGGTFIASFVEKAKYAHVDIAAMAYLENEKSPYGKGATGFGIRLMLAYLMK